MICILYSIFNNNKISWDILLKKKIDLKPGSRWCRTWETFYTKHQPQTWVQVVPHLGNEEIQTSSSRTCTWIQHEETSNHQGRERNSIRKKFQCYRRKTYTAKLFGIYKKIFSSVDLQFCNLFLKSSIVAW